MHVSQMRSFHPEQHHVVANPESLAQGRETLLMPVLSGHGRLEGYSGLYFITRHRHVSSNQYFGHIGEYFAILRGEGSGFFLTVEEEFNLEKFKIKQKEIEQYLAGFSVFHTD